MMVVTLSEQLTLAPCCSRSRTISAWPRPAAQMMGYTLYCRKRHGWIRHPKTHIQTSHFSYFTSRSDHQKYHHVLHRKENVFICLLNEWVFYMRPLLKKWRRSVLLWWTAHWTAYLSSDVRVCSFLQQKANHLHTALIRSPHKSGPAALQPRANTYTYTRQYFYMSLVKSLGCFPKHTSPESECYSDCRLTLHAQPVIISTVLPTHWHHDTLFHTNAVTGNDKDV